jgi:NAD(P)-dependent dehydrogenase (short-subunit alcohol dehydrogenase family)
VKADVTKPDEVETIVEKTVKAFGRLDFALNNAGIDGVRARTADYPEDLWHQVININLTGVFLCMKFRLPIMIKQGGGGIVNMSSEVCRRRWFPRSRRLHREQTWRHRFDQDRGD